MHIFLNFLSVALIVVGSFFNILGILSLEEQSFATIMGGAVFIVLGLTIFVLNREA